MENLRRKLNRLTNQLEQVEAEEGPSQIPESRILTPDCMDWYAEIEKLKIRPKIGPLCNLVPNPNQRQFVDLWLDLWRNDIPRRILECKSRQWGATTITAALHYLVSEIQAHIGAQEIAHKKDPARRIFRIYRRFWLGREDGERRPVEGGKPLRDRIEFTWPHESEIYVYTAGSDDIGRSETVQLAHWTEFAFWPQNTAADLYDGLMQCVPDDPSTSVVIESTANGTGNLFYDLCEQAKDPRSGWVFQFLGWKTDPTATMYAAPNEHLYLSPEEEAFKERWGLTRGQIKWARHKRMDQCRNSWDKFNQEYPVDASVAFLWSGFPWFSPEIITDQLNYAKTVEPCFKGDIIWKNGTHELVPMSADFPLIINEMPKPRQQYVLGVDVSEGVGADYTVIFILSLDPVRTVAKFKTNRIGPTDAGLKSYLLGMLYNYGLLGIERNGPGLASLSVCERGIKGFDIDPYPFLYHHTRTDKRVIERSQEMGFRTNRATKTKALIRLSEAIQGDDMVVLYEDSLLQMRNLAWDPKTEQWVMNLTDPSTGLKHDDDIMALAIANEMRHAKEFGQGFAQIGTERWR